MRNLLRSASITFSMYSRIPVPQVKWDESYMKHVFCFFPLIGVIIGGLEIAWYFAALALDISIWLFAVIATIVPVLVTGGLHLDGLLDTHDALASHSDAEKRRAILKDPHTGAFAVIHCCMYFLLSAGFYAQVYEKGGRTEIFLIALGYVISRSVCALCVVLLPAAKDSGLAHIFKNAAGKKAVLITQIVFLLAVAGIIVWLSPVTAALLVILLLATFFHFRSMAQKKFAGISGDLAGFILTRIELVTGLAVACVLLAKGVWKF